MRMVLDARFWRARGLRLGGGFLCALFCSIVLAQHVEPVPGVDVYSDGVGATPAQFRVDESGSATYTIPLVVPPGSGGVSPKLALSYDARAAWGMMGPGWQLSGLSSISRCKKSIEAGDGPGRDALDFAAPLSDQVFCLDGQRLVAQGGDLGACPRLGSGLGQQFAPEFEPATRVCAYREGSLGFERWLVYGADGSLRRYGGTEAARFAPLDAEAPAQAAHVLRFALGNL